MTEGSPERDRQDRPHGISPLSFRGDPGTAAFGYAPRPLPETLRDTLQWLRGE